MPDEEHGQHGVAWVAEDSDLEHDPPLNTARFSAHWESRPPGDWEEGPRDVSLEEALGWARRRSRAVIVMVDNNQCFSAGETWPPGWEKDDLPPWPKEGLDLGPRPITE